MPTEWKNHRVNCARLLTLHVYTTYWGNSWGAAGFVFIFMFNHYFLLITMKTSGESKASGNPLKWGVQVHSLPFQGIWLPLGSPPASARGEILGVMVGWTLRISTKCQLALLGWRSCKQKAQRVTGCLPVFTGDRNLLSAMPVNVCVV